jgi:pimeloyl-ACP methyl ester carboxylesterase
VINLYTEKIVKISGLKIHYYDDGDGYPVLLVPGLRYNAKTWIDVGTYDTIYNEGFKVISVDPPGQGKSDKGVYDEDTEYKFVNDFMNSIGIRDAVIVGASSGGYAAAGLGANYPEKVKGAVIVGGVRIINYKDKLKNMEGKPILLIWGSKDEIAPISNAQLILDNVKSSRLIYLGSQHACYLEKPKEFNDIIRDFLKNEIKPLI